MIRELSCLLILLAGLELGCSGGGGGGGGGDGRSTSTGVRLIHAAISETPAALRLNADLVPIQTARYGELVQFVQTPEGSATLQVERNNAPSVVFWRAPVELDESTEYSLLLYGDALNGGLKVSALPEPVLRPDSGFSRLQFLNAYQGESSLSVATAAGIQQVLLGGTSGFMEFPFGLQQVSILNHHGNVIGRLTVPLGDRGETTVVISGSNALGVLFTPLYQDLD